MSASPRAPGHRDATECDVGDALFPPPPRKFQRQPERPFWPIGRRSAYSLHPHLGGRLPTFHSEPELVGGPLREGKDVADRIRY